MFKVLTSGNQAWHWEITEINEAYSWESDPLPTTSTTKHVTKEKSSLSPKSEVQHINHNHLLYPLVNIPQTMEKHVSLVNQRTKWAIVYSHASLPEGTLMARNSRYKY